MSYRGKHRKQSATVKNIAKVGVAAVIVGVPTVATAAPAGAVDWDAVAQCESGGNWSTNTGNGFSGGLQFTPSTWAANGGSGSPEGASRAEQIRVAENVMKTQGIGAWPVCGQRGVGGSTSNVNSGYSGQQQQSAPVQQEQQTYSAPQQQVEQTAPVQEAAPVAPIKWGNGDYKVVAGDTLSKIASKKHVKGGWDKLYSLNKEILNDANKIFPGQKLHTK